MIILLDPSYFYPGWGYYARTVRPAITPGLVSPTWVLSGRRLLEIERFAQPEPVPLGTGG